ncbi:FAD-linked oxidoreductase-like protein [Aspergillus filifer]
MKAATPRPVRALSTKPSSYRTSRFVSRTSNAKSSIIVDTTSLLHQTTSAKKSLGSPLAKLPLSSILRSLIILSASSSSVLFKPCIYTLSALAHPKTSLLDVSKNPLLNLLVKHTIYKQFNAGENKLEVQRSINNIKQLGYRGVLLGYAREVLVGESNADPADEAASRKEIQMWLDGTLQTVDMAQEGDFVALKFTGMGVQALEYLQKRAMPSPFMDQAIQQICDLAISRNVRLLVDAEEQAVQPGIEEWATKYQKYCNSRIPGRAVFYNTYQAYLCSTPATLAKHLEISRKEGYTLGVKLVRGAYLKTEPRHLIWSQKEETDACYDGIVEALLTRKYNSMLKSASTEHTTDLPPVNVIIATHNRESVRKAHAVRLQQAAQGQDTSNVELSYAQLQGMADEISCELLEGFQSAEVKEKTVNTESPNVYKLLTWGSVKECMGFLLRRAVENTEAVGRTKQSQEAMFAELKRRARAAFRAASPSKIVTMYLLPEPAVASVLRSLTRPQTLTFLSTFNSALKTVTAQYNALPAEKSVHQPLRTAITTKTGNLSLFMPVSNTDSTGIKIVTASAKAGIIGVINIFSPEGRLEGLLSAAEITAFRTALCVMSLFVRATGLGLKRKQVVILGSGRQAEWHARLALLLCPNEIRGVTFVNRGWKRLEELERDVVSGLRGSHPDVQFSMLSKEGTGQGEYDGRLKEIIGNSDVIFSCTPSMEPNFPYSYLEGSKKSRFISLIGSYRPHMQEVDSETLLSGGGVVYVDSREACLEESGELIKAGVKGESLVELGELYGDEKLGEEGMLEVPGGQNVVLKVVGMGIMDLVTGNKLLEVGRERGVGMEVDGF